LESVSAKNELFFPPMSTIPAHLYPPGPPKCFPSPARRGYKSSAASLPRRRGEVKGREAGAGRDDRLHRPALHTRLQLLPAAGWKGENREGKEHCVGAPTRAACRRAACLSPAPGSPRRGHPRVVAGLLLMLLCTELFPQPHQLASDAVTADWPLR
jgi:hypothetical protein